MAYFDVRTGHALLGYVPAYGRYTMGASANYEISAITSALLNEIGQIKLGKPINLKLEAFVPDALELVLNKVLAGALSRYITTALDLEKPATAESIADVISSELFAQILPKMRGYVGNPSDDNWQWIWTPIFDVLRIGLKTAIKDAIVRVAKKLKAEGIIDPITGLPTGKSNIMSNIPIIPIAIGAGVLVLVLLLR
jgi:hypothetical protein